MSSISKNNIKFLQRHNPVQEVLFKEKLPSWIEEAINNYAQLIRRKFIAKKQPKHRLVKQVTPKEADSLRQIWLKLRSEYFPERTDLDSYKIIWSMRRQTRSLASCNVHTRKVSVAHAMNRPEYTAQLEALIYHEMCHAVLGKPEVKNGRRVVHGRDFKLIERRHPGIKLLDAWIKEGGWSRAVRSEGQKRRYRKASS